MGWQNAGPLRQRDLLEFSLVQISVVVFVILTELLHRQAGDDHGELYRAYLAIFIVVYVRKALPVRLILRAKGEGFLGFWTGGDAGTPFSGRFLSGTVFSAIPDNFVIWIPSARITRPYPISLLYARDASVTLQYRHWRYQGLSCSLRSGASCSAHAYPP